ncbi:sigma-70 family RNA polymerase sigma factor [Paenibacillus nanensis]|uniref:RNA polymerase sigma factor n=1 Tax=Paenibacillus nanensis TaxID=393251 RepID=A0A3A1UQ83_9BACL|nr:sigma-70 family RNA polymerase sigma factor [Paenibacillus nanensis]RIX48696.1 sigma-70 family RNA polymerase sigma factor [Paenibacillus nanensis]
MHSKLFLLSNSNYYALSPELQKEVYQEFYQFAYSPIIYMVKEHAATEDIIQNSFLKIIESVPRADNEAQLRSWLKVVVKNMVINYFRKTKKNRNDIDAESVYISESVHFATQPADLEQQVELELMKETISQCLKELRPEYRALIELRWKRELSYREIAAVLETSEESVKYKLYRARESMKKMFRKRWGDKHE